MDFANEQRAGLPFRHESNRGERVRWWRAEAEGSLGTQRRPPGPGSPWSVIRGVAEGSCFPPRDWVTLTGATIGQESGFWQSLSICVHERLKCEGGDARTLSFSEKLYCAAATDEGFSVKRRRGRSCRR